MWWQTCKTLLAAVDSWNLRWKKEATEQRRTEHFDFGKNNCGCLCRDAEWYCSAVTAICPSTDVVERLNHLLSLSLENNRLANSRQTMIFELPAWYIGYILESHEAVLLFLQEGSHCLLESFEIDEVVNASGLSGTRGGMWLEAFFFKLCLSCPGLRMVKLHESTDNVIHTHADTIISRTQNVFTPEIFRDTVRILLDFLYL